MPLKSMSNSTIKKEGAYRPVVACLEVVAVADLEVGVDSRCLSLAEAIHETSLVVACCLVAAFLEMILVVASCLVVASQVTDNLQRLEIEDPKTQPQHQACFLLSLQEVVTSGLVRRLVMVAACQERLEVATAHLEGYLERVVA